MCPNYWVHHRLAPFRGVRKTEYSTINLPLISILARLRLPNRIVLESEF
jgi:hypothetical protein